MNALLEAPPRSLGTCRYEGHMAIDFYKWKAEPSGMHSHAEHGNEEKLEIRNSKLGNTGIYVKMNVQHRTSNVQHRIMMSLRSPKY